MNSDSKVHAMTLAYTVQPGLISRSINVDIQKIDSLVLMKTYGMIFAIFSIQDEENWDWFFEEIFLLAYTSIEVVLGMSFLSPSNANFNFVEKSFGRLTWRSYSIAEALLTPCWVQLINKREFIKVVQDKSPKTFVIHMATLEAEALIYLLRAVQIAALQWDKAPTKVLPKYKDYADIFFSNLLIELPKNTGINDHAIKLVEDKNLLYELIYALSLVELEILKIYIEIYLKTGFIWPYKSSTGAAIFFD